MCVTSRYFCFRNDKTFFFFLRISSVSQFCGYEETPKTFVAPTDQSKFERFNSTISARYSRSLGLLPEVNPSPLFSIISIIGHPYESHSLLIDYEFLLPIDRSVRCIFFVVFARFLKAVFSSRSRFFFKETSSRKSWKKSVEKFRNYFVKSLSRFSIVNFQDEFAKWTKIFAGFEIFYL